MENTMANFEALKQAVEKADIEALQLLAPQYDLNRAMDSEEDDAIGTVLLHAINHSFYRGEEPRVIEWLLQNGANPNIPDYHKSNYPLPLAIASQLEEAVELLLKHGADPNILDGECYELAESEGNDEIIELLNQYKK